jgi:hypothetical protein
VQAHISTSGLGRERFARSRGLVPQRLYRWKRKLGFDSARDRSQALLPVRVAARTPYAGRSLRLRMMWTGGGLVHESQAPVPRGQRLPVLVVEPTFPAVREAKAALSQAAQRGRRCRQLRQHRAEGEPHAVTCLHVRARDHAWRTFVHVPGDRDGAVRVEKARVLVARSDLSNARRDLPRCEYRAPRRMQPRGRSVGVCPAWRLWTARRAPAAPTQRYHHPG